MADSARGQDLAVRLKATLDARAEAARRKEEEERRLREQAVAERARLLEDLAAFGEAVGWFEVTARPELLVLRFEGSSLRFEALGEWERLRIRSDALEGEHQLFLHPALGKWVWSYLPKVGAEQQRVFFDGGLEELVAQAFELRVEPEPEISEAEVIDEDPVSRSL